MALITTEARTITIYIVNGFEYTNENEAGRAAAHRLFEDKYGMDWSEADRLSGVWQTLLADLLGLDTELAAAAESRKE